MGYAPDCRRHKSIANVAKIFNTIAVTCAKNGIDKMNFGAGQWLI
jgi:uncharacterized metal-binding protein